MFELLRAFGSWTWGYSTIAASSIAIGLSAAAFWLLIAFQQNSFMEREGETAFDNVMVAQAPLIASMPGAPQLAFIDIDDDTYEMVQPSAVFPHDRLADLIRAAHDSGARAILVDIDVSATAPEAEDQTLLATLKAVSSANDGSWIFFVRAPSKPQREGEYETLAPAGPFDDFILQRRGRTRYVSGDLYVDPDGIVRRAITDVHVCTKGKTRRLIAGWIAAYAAVTDQIAPVDKILGQAKDGCNATAVAPEQVRIAARQVKLGLAGERARIAFHLPYRTLQSGPFRQPLPRQGDYGPIRFISAASALRSSLALTPARVADRVVFIGATHSFTKDIYQTPLGSMPGAVVLANAFHGLAVLGQIEPMALPSQTLVVVGLAAVLAMLFAAVDWLSRAPVIAGAFTVGTAWLVCLFIVPSLFYAQGAWFDGLIAGYALSFSVGFLAHNGTNSS